MTKRPLPSRKFLRQCFHYEPDTGKLWWKARPREHFPTQKGWKIFNSAYAGRIIDHRCSGDYIQVRISNYGIFMAHRIIWCWVTGDDPIELDHINQKRDDNRWSNLRLATHAQNCMNKKMRGHSVLGLKGVSLLPSGRFQSQIWHRGRRHHLGVFISIEAAHEAYCQAAQKFYGEFWSDGK